jgi:hypothetical protein
VSVAPTPQPGELHGRNALALPPRAREDVRVELNQQESINMLVTPVTANRGARAQ